MVVPCGSADPLAPDGYHVYRDDEGTPGDETDDTATMFVVARRCAALEVDGTTVRDLH